jgi:hypothetical protein
MNVKHMLLLACSVLVPKMAEAQINIFLGGNLQGNYSWMKGEEQTFQPGFGGGFSFVYWEYEYWFLKAGLDYLHRTSSSLDYPEDFDQPITQPDDKVQITYTEQSIGLPLTFYFRPYESGASTLLITGSFALLYTAYVRESTEEFGEVVLKGPDLGDRIKTNLGAGIGFQRQLDRNTYLNIVPSFNVDIRSPRAYRSITLTAELIFGVY